MSGEHHRVRCREVPLGAGRHPLGPLSPDRRRPPSRTLAPTTEGAAGARVAARGGVRRHDDAARARLRRGRRPDRAGARPVDGRHADRRRRGRRPLAGEAADERRRRVGDVHHRAWRRWC
nr:hypothetical protein [Angustibacter aerolatus]